LVNINVRSPVAADRKLTHSVISDARKKACLFWLIWKPGWTKCTAGHRATRVGQGA